MKCITLLLDGAADRSYKELNKQTPLQTAKLTHLDELSKYSQCGLMLPYKIGVSLGTDQAHMLLFGYELSEYPSRTIIDLIGETQEIDKDALYLRCSIATVKKDDGYLIHKRFTPNFSDENIHRISSLLKKQFNGFEFSFIHSYDSHGFIKIKGDIAEDVSDSDPFRLDYVMTVESSNEKIAAAINQYLKYSYDVLSIHDVNKKLEFPGNMILTKWAGRYKALEPFHVRNGMRGVIIGKSKLLEGLSKILGMDYYHYSNFDQAVDYALLCDYDYVHLHTKEPDEASHKKDPLLKVKVLEKLDSYLAPLVDFKGLLVVTSDHSTPCSGNMIHSGETVAFMAKGEYIRQDKVAAFDEISCSNGSIYLEAKDFMNYVINATDKGALFHLKQGSVKRNHLSRTNYRKLL